MNDLARLIDESTPVAVSTKTEELIRADVADNTLRAYCRATQQPTA